MASITDRNIQILHETLDGKTMAETGEKHGIGRNQVRVIVHTLARKKNRELYEQGRRWHFTGKRNVNSTPTQWLLDNIDEFRYS